MLANRAFRSLGWITRSPATMNHSAVVVCFLLVLAIESIFPAYPNFLSTFQYSELVAWISLSACTLFVSLSHSDLYITVFHFTLLAHCWLYQYARPVN